VSPNSRIVYTPGFRHVCLATKDASQYDRGTIVRCLCSRHYEACVAPMDGSLEWRRVRWWSLRARWHLYKERHFIDETRA